MSIDRNIVKDLCDANARGLHPPQNWTSRAIAHITALETGISKAIEGCEACGGTGFDVVDDGNGDIDKDPCQFCWDLRELIQDHTNYPLARAQAAAPPAPPAEKVVPFVRCTKLEFCTMAEGHAGECDDIPF